MILTSDNHNPNLFMQFLEFFKWRTYFSAVCLIHFTRITRLCSVSGSYRSKPSSKVVPLTSNFSRLLNADSPNVKSKDLAHHGRRPLWESRVFCASRCACTVGVCFEGLPHTCNDPGVPWVPSGCRCRATRRGSRCSSRSAAVDSALSTTYTDTITTWHVFYLNVY